MNLAIVSTNKDAYSETFIHSHVALLPATVHVLFDGYLPRQYSSDKGATSHSFIREKTKRFFFKASAGEASKEALQEAIAGWLLENKIDLMLCEYGPSGVAMLPVSKKTGVPLAVHFHGYDAYRRDVLEFYGLQYKALFGHAKAVIAVSRHMCGQLQKLGCDAAKLHCLPYGIDTAVFYRKEDANTQYTFAACGRFVEKKSPASTIHAFEKVLQKQPAATLVMIGDGELLAGCMALADELNLRQAVTFKGALGQQEIAEVFNSALVFVQHSVTAESGDSEGTPLALLESAACGLPAVSTAHAGISDVIEDGVTGFLVAEHDVSAMAEKMLLLSGQPALARQMGLSAAANIRAGYGLSGYTQRLWEVLQSCVG